MGFLEKDVLKPLPFRTTHLKPSAEALWIQELSRIQRFSGVPMIHRVDLFVHLRRVAFITSNLFPIIDPTAPLERLSRLFRLAYHHDDPEGGTGDVTSDVKAAMTDTEKMSLAEQEMAWAEGIADIVFNLDDPKDRA